MKLNCTTALSVSVAAAMCIGMTVTGQERPTPEVVSVSDTSKDAAIQKRMLHAGFESGATLTRSQVVPEVGRVQQQMVFGQVCPITQNNDPTTIVPGTVQCSPDGGVTTTENGVARMWPAGEVSAVGTVCFGVETWTGAADHEVEVNIYSGNITGPFANLTLMDSTTVTIPAGTGAENFTAVFPNPVNLPANQPVVVEIFSPDMSGVGGFFPGSNNLGQTAPSYLRSASCGLADYNTFAALGFPNVHILISLNEDEGVDPQGACCTGDQPGQCIEDLTLEQCDAQDGNWLGFGSTCASCPLAVTCPITCPEVDCPADLTGPQDVPDGVVDVFDLIELIGAWGPCPGGVPGCTGDITGPNGVPDGVVDVFDLIELIGAWGPCPQSSGTGSAFCENEDCGERINDGCNMDPATWMPIQDGQTVCGTGWTETIEVIEECPEEQGHLPGSCAGFCGDESPDGCFCDDLCWGFEDCCEDICEECFPIQEEVDTRDTDWYSFEVTADRRVTWSVHAEFPAVAIIATTDCEDLVIINAATSPAGVPFEIEACLIPGTYTLFVAPNTFTGLPCDGQGNWGDEYTATVTSVADICDGACCFIDGSCQELTPGDCEAQDGFFQGIDTTCAGVECPAVGASCDLPMPLEIGEGAEVLNTATSAFDTPAAGIGSCPGGPAGEPDGQHVAWFSVLGNESTLTATSCGSGQLNDGLSSVSIAVLCASCTNPTCVAGSSAASENFNCPFPFEFNQEVSWFAQDGVEYFIIAWGPSQARGAIQVEVNQAQFVIPDVIDCTPQQICGGDSGDCCSANGSPGCEDEGCCEAVCAGDPFCCDVDWDAFCATDGFDPDCLLGPGGCGVCNTPECDHLECPDCDPIGACCDPQGGCADDVPIADCQDVFGHFYVDQTCAEVTPCPDCGGAYTQDWQPFATAGTTDIGADLRRYELMPFVVDPITEIHVWGINAEFTPDVGFGACSGPAIPEFNVRIYEDDNGAPGALVCEELGVTATAVNTGEPFAFTTVIRFEIDLSQAQCSGDGRWISVEGASGTNCWFLWSDSVGGNGSNLLEDTAAGTFTESDFNLSICVFDD